LKKDYFIKGNNIYNLDITCEEMEESFILNRVRALSKNWKFLLLLITAVAIIIRSLPGWTSPAWGGDFGIYYGLTNSFIDTKSFYNPYLGWGASYQYFPVLYVITGIAHWITGIDVITIMPRLIPIFGGLSVGIFYFVVYELLNNRRSALLAASFFAVLPFLFLPFYRFTYFKLHMQHHLH